MKTIQLVPTINANDEFVVIVRWHAADGAHVAKGAPLVDVETTKAVVTIEAEQEGWLRQLARVDTEVARGTELAWYFSAECELVPAGIVPATAATAPPAAPPRGSTTAPAVAPTGGFSLTRLTPEAEKLATTLGLDPAKLARGTLGLVTSAGLRALLPSPDKGSQTADDGRRQERDPAAKRAEIQALTEGAEGNLRSSLTLYFDSAGVRARAEADGTGLLPLMLAELAPLLAAHPRFTAFHEAGRTVFYDQTHLGVAIDLGQGLRVVTIPNAPTLNAAAIGRRLAELTLDYMENRLAPAEVQGATFTVTDLSAFDVLQFEPLINGRQSAILGIGGDSTLPGHPMSLTIAFDHRVLNGREVGALLRSLRDRILARASPANPAPAATPSCCDRCLIEVAEYYQQFGAVGVMHQWTRPNGSTGLLCHSCLATL